MVNTIDLVLDGLSILTLGVFIYWVLRLQGGINRGERTHLKRRNLNTQNKGFNIAVLAYLIVTLYLLIANYISFALDILVPFGGLGSSTLLAMEAVGFLGLGYVLSVTNPVKKL